MDFNSILDFIKENSWVLGSGGVVGLIVLIKSILVNLQMYRKR